MLSDSHNNAMNWVLLFLPIGLLKWDSERLQDLVNVIEFVNSKARTLTLTWLTYFTILGTVGEARPRNLTRVMVAWETWFPAVSASI